jgi:peptidoglycan hydrolase-like protein with peptidoglycan-binding domain
MQTQTQKETFMVKISSALLSALLLSACSTMTENNETSIAETPALPASVEVQPVEPSAPAPVESARHELAAPAKKILSKQEVKMLQSQLKAAGFDPGPVDGTWGGRTVSALRRLQAGCANLKDLLENETEGSSTPLRGLHPKLSGADDIRLMQVRLKDAGFDVGAVDGVYGPKTKTAWLRFQAGCTMVNDWSATLENQTQISGRIPSPMPASERQLQSAPLPSPQATDSLKELGGQTKAVDRSPRREEVRLLQLQLKAAGFDPGPVDGMLGPKTKSALEQYRLVHGSSTSRKLSSGVGLKFDY